MCALSYLLGVPVTFPATAFFKKLKRCSLYNQVNFWCIYYIFCINNCLICWFHAYFFKLKWHVAFESIAYNCFQRSTQMYACTLRTCVGAFSKKYRCLSAQTLSERVCSWCDEETVVWCCETIDVWPLFFFFNLFCRPEALKSRGKKETVNFAAPCSPNYSSVFTVHIQSGHYPAACLQWQRTSRLPACCSVVVAK